MAALVASYVISKAEARGEIAPKMDAYHAEVELVRGELAYRQRQNDAIRAEATHAADYLQNAVFVLVVEGRSAHEMHQAARERYTESIARLGTVFKKCL